LEADAEPVELLRLRDDVDEDRVLDERLLDELDRFDPLLDLPVLRRSAISLPLVCRELVVGLFPQRGTISPHRVR
jgi:hypothetical protein